MPERGQLSTALHRFHNCVQQRGLPGVAAAVSRRCARGVCGVRRLVRQAAASLRLHDAVPLTAFAGRATTFKLENARLLTVSQQPWRTGSKSLEAVNPIPSMIHPDEAQFLYWLAAKHYRGIGTIVDLGPLAGGSTHALAAGLADNERAGPSRRQIESYDLWEYQEAYRPYFPGAELHPGDDLQGLFEANLGPLLPYVAAHKGDFCSHVRSGGPVEILFIDAAKTPAEMMHVVRHFFPRLIPGHAVVVFQDYISSTCPYIHLAMELLRRDWETVDSPEGGSVCFVPVRPLAAEALPADLLTDLSCRETRRLLQRARANVRGWYRLCLWLAEAYYLTQIQDYDSAAAIVRQVRAHADFCPSVEYDVEFVLRHLPSSKQEPCAAHCFGTASIGAHHQRFVSRP